MRLLDTLIQKVDGHDKRFDSLEGRMIRVEQKTDILTGQVTGIASKLIEIDKRLSALELRFESMELRFESMDHRLTSLETEVRQIRQEIADLHRKIDRNDAYREIIDELVTRVQKLEEKLVT